MPVLPLGFNPFNAQRILTVVPTKASLAATMVTVHFKDNCGPYRGGEAAVFLPDDAAALVAAGLATLG